MNYSIDVKVDGYFTVSVDAESRNEAFDAAETKVKEVLNAAGFVDFKCVEFIDASWRD